MRKYVHWLIVDRLSKDDKKQIESIKNYIAKHQGSKATVFFRNSGTFEWIVKLECFQCYGDLELDVNSFSTGLKRVSTKPKNMYESRKSFSEICEDVDI